MSRSVATPRRCSRGGRRFAWPATHWPSCRPRPMCRPTCRPTSRPAPRAPRRGDRMPELPEIQAHAERLTAEYAGATLQRFQPLSFVALKTAVPPPDAAYGRALDEVGRRGKYLLARFGDHTFVVHLMQGGRLKPDEKQAPKPRAGVARWRFADGRAWLLTEQGTEHKAGVWMVAGDPLG